ncbi:hypothetical protein Tco_0926195 [Tanacetum coccineum]|uniref:Reverse transcriptase Ty1/copia-type domain-containing protein n=1 Tax=Tanacetum coccineum TaxID=301880 RepID=A0ABQ5DC18_9ASTR
MFRLDLEPLAPRLLQNREAHIDYLKYTQLQTSNDEPSWINAMQEGILEFQRLKVGELVTCPDKVLLIKLKWIYKVKTDEFGGVLKNKARLVAYGFNQDGGENDCRESLARKASSMCTVEKAIYGTLNNAPRYHGLESKVMRECCFVVEIDAWLRGKFTLSPLDVLQGFSFFLQMGFTLILATLDGLDVGLLGDVIGEDDCDDDG